MVDKKIVLITDSICKITQADISNRHLEGNDHLVVQQIVESIREFTSEVEVYTSTERFLTNIQKHKNDIIFPLKYGDNYPNSKSIIPAICEAAELAYIGADDYTQMLCNDKHLAKLYAREFGIPSALDILLREPSDIAGVCTQLQSLSLPLIVKPNFGGGSTGISESNICNDYLSAAKLAIDLYHFHQLPILVEEYISGYEVELVLVGTKKGIIFSEEIQLIINGKENFTKEIWGFETKKIDDSGVYFKKSTYINKKIIDKLHSLFLSFDKVEFMRIDGRISNGEFHLIELSPDCFLGDDCAFSGAFQNRGYTLPQMFEILLNNGLNFHPV